MRDDRQPGIALRGALVATRLAVGIAMAAASSPAFAEPSRTAPEVAPDAPSTPPAEIGIESPEVKATARAAFALGLDLAHRGQFREAKAKFIEAYALLPHPIVAYNAALACLALGERDEAIELLDRALASESEVGPEEREAIRSTRAAIVPPVADPTPADRSAPPPAPQELAPQGATSGREPAELGGGATIRASRNVAPAVPPRPSPVSSSGSKALGYGIGAAGLGLLVVSGALYLWNDGRHGEWQEENEALHARQDALLAAGQIPKSDVELRQRASDNDALLRSVHTVDAIDAVVAAAGLACVGVGAYLTFRSGDSTVRVALGPRLEIDARF